MADSIPDYVTKGEFNTFKQEVFDKFAEVATKKDLELVNLDVSELKQDVSGLKHEVANLNQKIDRLEKQTQANTNSIDKLIIKVADMDEKMVTRDEFNRKFDIIITKAETLAYSLERLLNEMRAKNARYSRTN